MFIQSYKNTNSNQPSRGEKSSGAVLDTLAQLRKPLQNQPLQEGKKTLFKRARAKYISNALSLKLKDLHSELEASYFRTYGCASLLIQEEDRLTGRYCNNRWCLVCNRIRTAKLIKGYIKPLQELSDPYFVTLTVPNVPGEDLRDEIKRMIAKFRQIKDAARKAQISLKGIRKIECTYNRDRKTFHPHFHLIVEGRGSAQHIVSSWLDKFPEATRDAQDLRPADDNSIYELFKYFTKINYKNGTEVQALDQIFIAMQGLRTFQPMGIKKVSEDVDELTSEVFAELEKRETQWVWVEDDWVDIGSGELLTGHIASEASQTIVSRFIMPRKKPKTSTPPPLVPLHF